MPALRAVRDSWRVSNIQARPQADRFQDPGPLCRQPQGCLNHIHMYGRVATFLPSRTESHVFIPLAPRVLKWPQMKQSILLSPGHCRFHSIHMKRLLSSLTFVALLAGTLAAFAQTAPPADDATAAGAAAAQDATQPPAPADKAPAAEAPAPAAAPAPAIETAQAVPANDAAQPTTPASAPSTAAPEAAKAASSSLQPGVVIPLIVMDDVPLTDAIRNLARQSGINYMLDPRIGFGQVGPDGRPTAQPNVSIRWENVTAEQALAALLNNYTLQMVEDPKSRIARI